MMQVSHSIFEVDDGCGELWLFAFGRGRIVSCLEENRMKSVSLNRAQGWHQKI